MMQWHAEASASPCQADTGNQNWAGGDDSQYHQMQRWQTFCMAQKPGCQIVHGPVCPSCSRVDSRPQRSGTQARLRRQMKRLPRQSQDQLELVARVAAHRAGGVFVDGRTMGDVFSTGDKPGGVSLSSATTAFIKFISLDFLGAQHPLSIP